MSLITKKALNTEQALQLSNGFFDDIVLPTLQQYIAVPCVSPNYDKDWKEHGDIDRAVAMVCWWVEDQHVPGLTIRVEQIEGRTPLIFIEIASTGVPDTVLMYGHLDKQPEMTGWREGLGPWNPVLEGNKLYGRGGADDGYSTFAAIAATLILADQDIPHARLVIVIEACEESGSRDLPAYMDMLADEIGTPSLVICLDSGCGTYDRLWLTNSLRGVVNGKLEIRLLAEGIHSGGSGRVPDCSRIERMLIARIEYLDGTILLPELRCKIPEDRFEEISIAANVLGDAVFSEVPWLPGAHPDPFPSRELLIEGTWRPALTKTGFEGLPDLKQPGNVLPAKIALELSMRLPPLVDPQIAAEVMKRVLEADPPYGAQVTFTIDVAAPGYNAPSLAPWLAKSVKEASMTFFGKPAVAWGEGGTIPFMGMLGAKFPNAQFLITGLLGPHSNAHGPNEFLHIPTFKRLTACVAQVIADHGNR